MPWQYQMLGIPVERSHWELAEGDLRSGWWQRILRRVQHNGPTQTWLKAAESRGWWKDLRGSLLVCVSQNITSVFKTNTLFCQLGDSRPLMNKELLSLTQQTCHWLKKGSSQLLGKRGPSQTITSESQYFLLLTSGCSWCLLGKSTSYFFNKFKLDVPRILALSSSSE